MTTPSDMTSRPDEPMRIAIIAEDAEHISQIKREMSRVVGDKVEYFVAIKSHDIRDRIISHEPDIILTGTLVARDSKGAPSIPLYPFLRQHAPHIPVRGADRTLLAFEMLPLRWNRRRLQRITSSGKKSTPPPSQKRWEPLQALDIATVRNLMLR